MTLKSTTCAICSRPLASDFPVWDDRGRPVHGKCHSFLIKMKGVNPEKAKVVRCPYCVEDGQFKLMHSRADGEWFMCPICGHATMPGHSTYHCNCARCAALL